MTADRRVWLVQEATYSVFCDRCGRIAVHQTRTEGESLKAEHRCPRPGERTLTGGATVWPSHPAPSGGSGQ